MSRPEHNPINAPRESDERLKLVITGLEDNIRTQAREAADGELNQYLEEKKGFRGFLRKIWAGNVAREIYQQRLLYRKENEIKESQNLYIHHEGVTDEDWRFIKAITVDRYISDYDEAIRQEAGETREVIDGSESEAHNTLRKTVLGLVTEYVDGDLDADNFEEEKNRRLADLARENETFRQLVGTESLYADNILEIAQVAKARVSHEQSLQDILDDTEFIAGRASLGVRSEQEMTMGARIIEKVSKTGRFLVPVNEATVATAASIVYSLAGWSAKSVVGAATRVGVIGTGAATIAGIREYYQTKRDRTHLSREIAQGGADPEASSKRREQLKETLYEAKQANDLTVSLEEFRSGDNDEWQIDSKEKFDALMTATSESLTRLALSDLQKKDFIHFSHVAQVEVERHTLLRTSLQAKAALRHYVDGLPADEREFLLNGYEDFDKLFAEQKDMVEAALSEEVELKDQLAKKMARKRAMIAAGTAAGVGVGLGLGVQEAVSAISDSRIGLIDQLGTDKELGSDQQTLLHGLMEGNEREQVIPATESADSPEGFQSDQLNLSENISISHGDTLDVVKNSDGSISIETIDGKTISELELRPDGSLASDAKEALRQAGINLSEHHRIVNEPVSKHVNLDVRDFIANHQKDTAVVSREFWYDNDTASFDQNELKLDLSVNKQGDIEYSIDRMLPDGSYHDGNIADLQPGNMVMAISASADTQKTPFLVPLNASGEAIIDKDSAAAKLFTVQEDGSVIFNGRYGEMAEVSGGNQRDGFVIRPLATDTGPGMEQVGDIVRGSMQHNVISYDLSYETPTSSQDIMERTEAASMETLVPPVLPWYPRGGIGRAKFEQSDATRGAGYSSYGEYFRVNPAERKRLLSRMSPRLRSGERPDVELNEREELSWYRDSQDPVYRARIDRHAEALGTLGPDTDLVVSIPVAGHQEAANIYRTLEAYTSQTLASNKYEILLYINNPAHDRDGQPLNSNDTIAEVERFMRDYPDMPVRYFHESLSSEEAKISFVRKVLNDTAMFRALGRKNNGQRDVILVSNDADTTELHPAYLANWIEQFDKHPEYDAMLGQLDWDNETYLKYPEINIATKFFLFRDIIMRKKTDNPLVTSGANSTILAKNLAAIGGYDVDTEGAGEDVKIGRALVAARKGSGKSPIGFGGVTKSRLVTSARRSVYTLEAHNDAPYNQWNYGFGAHDELRVAKHGRQTYPRYDSPAEVKKLENSVESLINHTLQAFNSGAAISQKSSITQSNRTMTELDREAIERSLAFCGVKYRWSSDGETIRVTDVSDMIQGLREYELRTSDRLFKEEAALIAVADSNTVELGSAREAARQVHAAGSRGVVVEGRDGQRYRLRVARKTSGDKASQFSFIRQRVDGSGVPIAPSVRLDLSQVMDELRGGAYDTRALTVPARIERFQGVRRNSRQVSSRAPLLKVGQIILNDRTRLPRYKGNMSGWFKLIRHDQDRGRYYFNELDDNGRIIGRVNLSHGVVERLLLKGEFHKESSIVQHA